MNAQITTEKSVTLRAGDVVSIDNISSIYPITSIKVLNYDYNDINFYITNGNLFGDSPKNTRGKRTITVEYKIETPSGIKTLYRIYNLFYAKSLVVANDDALFWNGEDTINIDFISNDEIFTSADVMINFVSEGIEAKLVDGNLKVNASGEFSNAKYIQYTIKDTFGVSDQAIITIEPELSYNEDTSFNFVVNYLGSKQISIPNGFDVSKESKHGILNGLGPNHVIYKPLDYFIGLDTIIFENNVGTKLSYFIRVIDAQRDGGLLKDDIVYTPINTPITFDVQKNDIINNLVIDSFSNQLVQSVPGVFTYAGSYAGVKNFGYRTLAESGVETAKIKINVGNFYPENLNYNLQAFKNSTYIMDYNVPIEGYLFTVKNAPLHGKVNFYSNETPEMACGIAFGKYLITYTPDNDFIGEDNFALNYCINGSQCKSVVIKVNVAEKPNQECNCINDCVYPGDIDGDGRVSAADILVLGRFMGASGPQRATANSAVWLGEQSAKWGINNSKGNDLMHADANGNGVIDQGDINYIYQNFGKIKGLVPRPSLGFKDFPFEIIAYPEVVDSGETQTLYFVLGDENLPANAVHGMSFNLNLGPIDSASLKFEFFQESWLTKGSPSVAVAQQTSPGVMNIGLTIAQGGSIVGEEADGFKAVGVSGYGIIAKATYVVGEEADGFKVQNISGTRTLKTSNVEMEDLSGDFFDLNDGETEIRVRPTENKLSHTITEVFTYPNPVVDKLIISTKVGKVINKAVIYDLTGRILVEQNNNTNEIHIDLAKIDLGIYIAKINVDGEEIVKKVVKK
jgi:hypothetical protein